MRLAARLGVLAVFGAGCRFDPAAGVPSVDGNVLDASTAGDAGAAPDAPADAAPDAAPAACPGDYVAAGSLASRYRITAAATAFRAAHDDCKDDRLGHTHLVVLDAPGELAALRAQFPDIDGWIGAVQAPTLVVPWDNWSHIIGGPAALPWKTGQPDDDGGVFGFEANIANVAASVTGGAADRRATMLHVGICECDHRAVAQDIEAEIPN